MKNKKELNLCKCGCGLSREKYDKKGREREFINRHQRNGKKISEGTREKLSNSHKEQIPWNKGLTKEGDERVKNLILKSSITRKKLYEKGKIKPWNKGKKKLYIGPWKGKKRPEFSGEKHPNWKGGIARLPYDYRFNKRFKEMIRDRDNYTCQLCKKQKPEIKQLSVHHIDYNKINSTTFNCIALCKKCHSLTNFNRDKWKIFFQSYLRDKYNYNIRIEQTNLKELNNE